MATGQPPRNPRSNLWGVLLAGWPVIVVLYFALRHPVRDPGLWLAHLGGISCVGFLLFSASLLGRRVLAWLGPLPSPLGERCLLSLGLGLLALTYLTLGLGLVGLLYRGVGWLLILLPIVAAFRDTRAVLEEGRALVSGNEKTSPASLALAVVLAPILLGTLWLALAPVSAHDALVYHLNLPKHYVAGHRVAPLAMNVYSGMPHNLEILSTLAYLTGGETSAVVMDFAVRLIVCWGVYALARRFLSPPGSLLAVILFLLNPVVTSARTVGNIDLGMALFFLLAVLAVSKAQALPKGRAAWLPALFCGYLMGCKYTGVFFAASGIVFLLFALPRSETRRWGVPALLLLAPVAPWLVRNLAATGNPLYPLFPSVFESREWDAVLGQQLVRWQRSMGMGRGIADYLLLPWNVFLESQMGRGYRYFDGVLSPLPLVFLPFVVRLKNRGLWGRLLGLCVIPFAGWAATSQQVRFLIPILPLISVTTAAVIWSLDHEGFGSTKGRFRAFGISLTLAFLTLFQLPLISRNVARALPAVAGNTSREAYLSEVIQPHAVIRRANEVLPPTARVLMIWENRGYYLERPYLADSFFEASQIARLAARAGSPAAFAESLRSRGVSHVIYNHGLGQYFQTLYPREYGVFLRRFVEDHLEPLHSEREVTLYRLKAAGEGES